MQYTSFDGDVLELTPWTGRHLAILTQTAALDPAAMSEILATLDRAYEYYMEITGREPTPWGPTTYEGRGTIAVVEETCGAGCGYLGFTGIEIMPRYFGMLHDGVQETGTYEQVLFYELGRNFWFYDDQLGALTPFVTGFAMENRFLSMDAAGVEGNRFGDTGFDTFRDHVQQDMARLYFADPELDWRNTLAEDRGPENDYGLGAADLAASLLHRIEEDFGGEAYGRFWRALEQQPAAATPEAALANLLDAASEATGVDYGFLAKEGWSFDVGTADGDSLRIAPSGHGTDRTAALGFQGDDAIAGSDAGDTLAGGRDADRLAGGRGGDTLLGGPGDDCLIGGWGGDILAGGDDADRFVYRSRADSRSGPDCDLILDFDRADGDLIDLRPIDADTDGTSRNQAFDFIGATAFSGVDGQLRFADHRVQGDMDGDRAADFELEIAGLSSMQTADFLL